MTMPHEHDMGVHVGDGYVVDTLGAPFKVTVLDGVTVNADPHTGEEVVTITDVVGLIGAVVRARAVHPRKLNGAEIKFIRNALGVKANVLADFLDISPEHLSRCENRAKVMSALVEKNFRFAAYLATLTKDPPSLLVRMSSEENKGTTYDFGKKEKEKLTEFLNIFFSMKITPVFAAGPEPLEFVFSREGGYHDGAGNDEEWDSAA